MKAHNKETQAQMTPRKALQFLQEGNDRFINNLKAHRDLLEQVNETRDGQWPFATILSCIDSRTSTRMISSFSSGYFKNTFTKSRLEIVVICMSTMMNTRAPIAATIPICFLLVP
jgi:hypothetical protein